MPAPTNFLQGVLGSIPPGNSATFEPQRVNNALLRIDGLNGAGPDADYLQLSIASFPLPKVSNNAIEVGYLNEKRKFAGNPVFDNLACVFNDYIDINTAMLLLKWRHQVYDPTTGRIGLKTQYAKVGDVTLFAPNGDDRYTRVYLLQGVWPSMYDPGEIDHMGEDTVKINLELTIDKAIPSVGLDPDLLSAPGLHNNFGATG